MQTDLSYGVQQEQHDTHASWLPRACLFRVFTSHRDNCDFLDILILSHYVGILAQEMLSNVLCECVISFIVPRMSSSRDVKSRDCMRSYTIRLTYVIHLFITVSSLLQCKGICVTRVHIMKCRHFTFKLMIKIECSGRRISAKEISLTIDETCTQKSSTYLPFSYFYQSQRDNCNLLNIFVLSH